VIPRIKLKSFGQKDLEEPWTNISRLVGEAFSFQPPFSSMDLSNLNTSVESDFELAEETLSLGPQRPAPPDRSTIVQSEAGNASFRAELERVQYGTYKGQPACLLTFTFLFYFNGQSRLRFQSAKITIRFRRERSATASRQVVDDDDDDGPHILQLAPFRVYGELKNRTEQRTLKVAAPVGFQTPVAGFHADVVPSIEKSVTEERTFRLSIQGGRRSTMDTDNDDLAFWHMNENAVQRDGILPRLQTAIVLRWPSGGDLVLANVRVAPEFSFSVRHALQLLRQRRDDPIAFDGKAPKGDPVNVGTDFADKAFDWSKVLDNPTEYQVSLLLPPWLSDLPRPESEIVVFHTQFDEQNCILTSA
jgi:hypothetical protein